jgi:signal transduction histidine kinase
MDSLIHDLLAYCHIAQERVELDRLDPAPIIRHALSHEIAQAAPREVEASVEDGLPTVLGHAALLSNVFTQLISNALKFTAPDVRPQVRIGCETSEKRVRLWIKDNGVGIPVEYHDRVFKPFERLDASGERQGTGIGLAIVRVATERMRGQVGLESEPGKGSTFWVELVRDVAAP